MSEQTASATWARVYPRLMRNIEELRGYDCEIKVPPNFEIPPHKRGLPLQPEAGYSTGTGGAAPGNRDEGSASPQNDTER